MHVFSLKERLCMENSENISFSKNLLILFMPMSRFYTPWKCKKPLLFWHFQEIWKWDIGVKRVKTNVIISICIETWYSNQYDWAMTNGNAENTAIQNTIFQSLKNYLNKITRDFLANTEVKFSRLSLTYQEKLAKRTLKIFSSFLEKTCSEKRSHVVNYAYWQTSNMGHFFNKASYL